VRWLQIQRVALNLEIRERERERKRYWKRKRKRKREGAMGNSDRGMLMLLLCFFFFTNNFLPSALAIWLTLPASGTKCVSEEIQNNVVVLADYVVIPTDHSHNPTIALKVPFFPFWHTPFSDFFPSSFLNYSSIIILSVTPLFIYLFLP